MGSIYVMNWRNRKKQELIAYKGGKCQRCGYKKPILRAYDFHHRDPSEKDFCISGKSFSMERLKKEVDKCDLVCRNCHAEIHWELENAVRQQRLLTKRSAGPPTIVKACDVCKKKYQTKNTQQKFCSSECYGLDCRKVTHPTKQKLSKLISQGVPFTQLGKLFGVSDKAVKKWATKYGLKNSHRKDMAH